MIVDIDKIKVNERIRKDFGDLQELADSIVAAGGLIHPPAVTPDFELIAGERRLRACRDILGWKQMEVHVMPVQDAEHQLMLEIDENETHKSFSKAERIDYGRRLERIEAAKAKERQATSTGGSNPQLVQKFAQAEQTKTRDMVAEKLGIGSGETYRKEKYIADNRDQLAPEDFADWDEGRLSTNKAYQRIKARLQEAERRAGLAEQEKENLQVELSTQEAEYQKQLAAMAGQVKTVTVTEYPDDYDELQNLYARYVAENQRLRDENQQTTNTVRDLQSRLEHYTHHGELQNAAAKLESDAMFFHVKCNEFITAVGGYLYLAEHIAELPKPQQEAYWQSVMSIAAWAQNILSYREELLLND